MRVRGLASVIMTVTALSLVPGSGHAAPTYGSPLVGDFCSRGAAIAGAGATFANNAHTLVFIPAYEQQCGKGSITYASTGSGAGKLATRNRTHAWGGTDEPLSADEKLVDELDLGDPANPNPRGRVSPLHQVPIAVGAVSVPYNLEVCGVTGNEALKFTSSNLSSIFTGLITRWNDDALVQNNPKLATCNRSIKLVVRQDGSGTTYVFKDYLSKRNPHWNVYKQNQFNTSWPSQDLGYNVPIRGNGNGGVAAAIKITDASIGYVELSTAKKNFLVWAKVENPLGQFNSPAQGAGANCDEAATAVSHPPSTLAPGWDIVSMTDSPNENAYAICSMTYALIYNDLITAFGGSLSAGQQQTLVDYFGLALEDSVQAKLNQAGFAKLPSSVLTVARVGLASVASA